MHFLLVHLGLGLEPIRFVCEVHVLVVLWPVLMDRSESEALDVHSVRDGLVKKCEMRVCFLIGMPGLCMVLCKKSDLEGFSFGVLVCGLMWQSALTSMSLMLAGFYSILRKY